MKNYKKTVIAGAICLSSLLFTTQHLNAGTVMGNGGNLEVTQLLVLAEEAANLVSNLKQYETMLKNLETLPEHIKQLAIEDLQTLAGSIAEGRALAYRGERTDEIYKETYKNYDDFMTNDYTRADFQERYKNWSETNHDSVRAALRNSGLQAEQFAREDSALKSIELQMQTGVGQKQLLQAGGSIAAMQVEQMQKLRQLVMAQTQMQAASIAGETDKTAQKDAMWARANSPYITPIKTEYNNVVD